jgi:hypothetical protein
MRCSVDQQIQGLLGSLRPVALVIDHNCHIDTATFRIEERTNHLRRRERIAGQPD